MLNIFDELFLTPEQREVKNSYEDRKIGFDEIGGLFVSTVYATDLDKYETAIGDAAPRDNIHPVERYEDKIKAEAGHKRWIEWCKNQANTTITRLGTPSTEDWPIAEEDTKDREITLVRGKDV